MDITPVFTYKELFSEEGLLDFEEDYVVFYLWSSQGLASPVILQLRNFCPKEMHSICSSQSPSISSS